jgi:hypothetical protein
MLNSSDKTNDVSESTVFKFSLFRTRLFLIIALGILVALFQFACSKKSKVSLSATSVTRVAFLPLNVPENSKDLRWTAMAAPIALAEACRNIKDIEIIPLWQTMPLAIQTAGNSRMITQEGTASVAAWLSASWATYGEFQHTKRSNSMIIDFIPTKETMIPFRYSRIGKLEGMEPGVFKALEQFMRYALNKRLDLKKNNAKDFTSYRRLAEALDREYGWSMEAEPGKAQGIVAELIQTDDRLARYLFSPTLYPALQTSQKKQ